MRPCDIPGCKEFAPGEGFRLCESTLFGSLVSGSEGKTMPLLVCGIMGS